jgi:[NiFe] hydrogenase diaphorase moiety large subunit
LGQTAANPILTTLERYPELYQSRTKNISFDPGFDLDAALETARRLANRDDEGAHLAQTDAESVASGSLPVATLLTSMDGGNADDCREQSRSPSLAVGE